MVIIAVLRFSLQNNTICQKRHEKRMLSKMAKTYGEMTGIYAIGDCARSSAKYKSCDGGSRSALQENTVSVVLYVVR